MRLSQLGSVLALATLVACSTSREIDRPIDLPFERVFPGTYEDIWNATVSVLDIYSIAVANRESGVLKTEWSDARYNSELFEYPDRPERLEEVRYRLIIKLAKGLVAESGRPAVRVQVTKELSEYKNFFSDWERVPTDQIEENVVLYRIEQRLRIVEALKRKKVGAAPAEKSP